MVWFQCGDCGESVKKPKVDAHMGRCSSSHFTCLDCSRTFGRQQVKEHSVCVSEQDKYAAGATKPGGYAAAGFFGPNPTSAAPSSVMEGCEYLSTKPPWHCSICEVVCTSRQTLENHAAGAKHKRRAKAAGRDALGHDDAILSKAAASGVQASSHTTNSQPEDGKLSISAEPQTPLVVNGHKPEVTGDDVLEGHVANSRKIKWKSMATRHLRAASGSMKLKKLHKQLLAEVEDPQASHAMVMIGSLQRSSRFRIENGRIALKAK